MPYELKLRMNDVIKNYIDPLMKINGYKKKSSNYYKQKSEIIFIFNIQNYAHFEDVEYSFFINCGIHSQNIDNILGKEKNDFPKYFNCTFSTRIENIIKKNYQSYSIKIETNTDDIGKQVAEDLKKVFEYFSEYDSNDLLINRIVDFNLRTLYEREFLLVLAKTNKKENINKFLFNFENMFEDKIRGKKMIESYISMLKENGVNLTTASS